MNYGLSFTLLFLLVACGESVADLICNLFL